MSNLPWGFELDWSLTFGNFLTIIVVIVGGTGFVYTIRGRVDGLSERMLSIENQMKQLVEVLIKQGRHDERMNAQQQQINSVQQRIDNLSETVTFWLNGRARQASSIPPDQRTIP